MTDQGIRFKFSGDSSGVEAAASKTVSALGKVKGASNTAGTALLNLGRVAQDSSFGFIGIANNLNPLLESFQRLRSEAGSNVGALKALGTSLIGAGGIGLALSLVTAAVSFAQMGFSAWTRGMQKNKEEIDKNREAYRAITKDIADEAAKVGVLIGFIKQETTTREQRTAAIKQLQTIAPAYFAQLNAEKATVEELSSAYAAFSQNIVNSITARIREGQLRKILEERIKLQDFLNSLGKEESVIINGVLVKARNFLLNAKEKTQAQARVNQLLQNEKTLTEEINRLKPPDLKIPPPKETKIKVGKAIVEPEKIEIREPLGKQIDALFKIHSFELPESAVAKQFSKIKAGPQLDLKPISEAAERIIEFRELMSSVAAVVTRELGGAFAGLFEGILSGSQNAFQAFAQALGNIIKRLIATAAAAALLTIILGPLGLVKGAGTTALKGFAAFKSLFSSIGGFAEGGVVSGPKSGYPAILHGKEVVAPFDKFMGLINGGGMNKGFIAETVISGNDLRILVKRADQNAGRLF